MRGYLACMLLAAALLCTTSVLAATSVQVVTRETGRITDYYGQYWVVNVNGTVTVSNPSPRDLFEVVIRYDIGSLSLIELGTTSSFHGGQLIIPRIPANGTASASYNIVGISLQDPTLIDRGVLYSAMTKFTPVIYSDTFGALNKASLEDASYTGRNARLITVELKNPTGFQYTIVSLKVIKTPSLDPNQVLATWDVVNESSPFLVNPDTIFVRDILDRDSAEGQVYWLVSDVYISQVNFTDISNVTRYTELNLTIPAELLNYTINSSNETNATSLAMTELYAKKLADRQVITADEPVQLSLLITNFAQRLFSFSVTDELPPGFEFVSGEGWTDDGGRLTYTGTLSGKAATVISYRARLSDTNAAGLDYFGSAQIDYKDERISKTVYSDRVPFIRQYLPEKKIYVQKRLRYEEKNQVSVSISVQNLGSTPIEGILLKEYLEDDDLFSSITEQPAEKGLWELPELQAGGTWEVTYTTTEESQLNVLPGVYGVPAGDVLKSLVLENVISTAWESVRTALLEMVGIALLLGLPIVYYFIKKRKQSL